MLFSYFVEDETELRFASSEQGNKIAPPIRVGKSPYQESLHSSCHRTLDTDNIIWYFQSILQSPHVTLLKPTKLKVVHFKLRLLSIKSGQFCVKKKPRALNRTKAVKNIIISRFHISWALQWYIVFLNSFYKSSACRIIFFRKATLFCWQ